MKSFFTSSLDKIDPPSPFVNAMNWDSYRSQFRSDRNRKSSNRNCVLALGTLNPESELSAPCNCGQDIPLIIQNTIAGHISFADQAAREALSTVAVDECFGDADADFLSPIGFQVGRSGLNDPSGSNENAFDLELGLLESLQEVAISLVRNTPKRTISVIQAAD